MAPENQSVRQRARNDRSGKAAAAVMYGTAAPADQQQQQQEQQAAAQPTRRPNPHARKDNFRNPSDFYAGPSKPGQIHGVRRNKHANRDSVGYLLTDEGLMSIANGNNAGGRSGSPRGGSNNAGGRNAARGGARGAGANGANGAAGNKPAKVPLAERTHVDFACNPTAPEPEWRSGVRVTHPQGYMDAPYYEDLDPKDPREVTPVTGKRHVKPVAHKQPMFIDPSKPLTEEEAQAARPVTNRKTNKANESVNVLRLDTYKPNQLNEPPQRQRQLGPRRWTAPEMPPKPKSAFAPVKSHAKDEHDVLGTGRWGTPEEPRKTGVGRGACRPKRDNANLFAGDQKQRARRDWVPPSEVRKPSAQQRKYAGQPNLLKYYDPNVDGPAQASKPRAHGNRANEESRPDPNANTEYRPSRAPGMYSKNGQPSSKSLW